MEQLPDEILIIIFKYFNKKEQLRMSLVNKRFRSVFLTPVFWKTDIFMMVKEDFVPMSPPIEYVGLVSRKPRTKNYESFHFIRESKFRSFAAFMLGMTFLKALNLTVSLDVPYIDLAKIFEPLHNLECLVLSHPTFQGLKRLTFPCTLKHISMYSYNLTDDVLVNVADCCPELEHVCVMSSYPTECGCYDGMDYLLKKANATMRSVQISSIHCTDRTAEYLSMCSKLEALFIDFTNPSSTYPIPVLESFKNYSDNLFILSINNVSLRVSFRLDDLLRNTILKNLKILCISNSSLNDSDFVAISSGIPNLEILYLRSCDVNFASLTTMVKSCVSLKELALDRLNYDCYEDQKLLDLIEVKVATNKTLEIYIDEFRLSLCTALPRTRVVLLKNLENSFNLSKLFFFESCLVSTVNNGKRVIETAN